MKEIPDFRFALRDDLKDEKQFLPTRAEPSATGYDCRAAMTNHKDLIVRPGQTVIIPLGFRCFCPSGWFYYLHPRSSFFMKKQMHSLIGIIDECFPLELNFVAKYIPDSSGLTKDLIIKFGEPIAQIIPTKRETMFVDGISNAEIDELFIKRGAIRTGGFGSTSPGFYKTGSDS